ncbi:MAG TPA: monovalent cation/H(+) antiporter subunit G [bacterium]|nr:monovalent cation/H(+) antiporter subunit G [bacterium]HOL65986.1 monovalent cation/H(+) antiporter subunit G [bacterium]HPP11221.1 monovalent cation/H(+) antiporter subunit G [bacterium]
MRESLGYGLMLFGALFDLFGCVGLVRLPDIYNRLQAATKCVTLGTCMILLGTLALCGFTAVGAKIILCIIFVLITSPTAAHALAKASHLSGIRLWEGSVCDQLEEDKKL